MRDWTNPPAPATASTAGVLHPELFARYVDLRRWPVAPGLDRWVENYWGLRWSLPAGLTHHSRVLPHPACNLTLEQTSHPRPGLAPKATVLTGVVTHRFEVPVAGDGLVVGAKFRPGGLAHLLGMSARAWTDQVQPAADILPPDVAAPLAALDLASLFEDGPGPLEELLERLRPSEPEGARYDRLLAVIADMLGDRTLVTVAQVLQRHRLSERTLQRWFEGYVGVGPKWVLGRYRMHDVVTELDAGYDGPLADLAHVYGWYDQSHFIRDFRKLIGVTPSEYLRRRGHVAASSG